MLRIFSRPSWPALQQLANGASSGPPSQMASHLMSDVHGNSSFMPVFSSGGVREASQFAITNAGVSQGAGGRSSASGITATVFGGYGFVGSYVVNELGKRGSQVIVPSRTTDIKTQHIKQMGDLGQIVMLNDFSLKDTDFIKRAIARSNVVINLVGQRTETMNFTFDDVHAEWPKRLAKVVADAGHVERFVHFSDIAASPTHASRRLRSKAAGDKAVRELVPSATIMKPAPVVGIEDYFFNAIIHQVSYSLTAPLVENGAGRVQPAFVLDVSHAVMEALRSKDAAGKDFYLGGPEVLTYRQVYDVIIKTLRLRTDDTIPIPAWLARLMYGPTDWARRSLPPMPMDSWMFSSDYVEEVLAPKIVPPGALGFDALGINPMAVTEGLPIEPVRHFRAGGYGWGDMSQVADKVPEEIKKYYNLK